MLHWLKTKIMSDSRLPQGLKGSFNSECNRTDCKKPQAVFYNYSTKKYYCPACAKIINTYNRVEAMEMFGHDLCLYQEKEKDESEDNTNGRSAAGTGQGLSK